MGALCAGRGVTARLDADGAVLWQADGDGRLRGTVGARFVQRGTDGAVLVRSVDDGRVLERWNGQNGQLREDGSLMVFRRLEVEHRALDGEVRTSWGPPSVVMRARERPGAIDYATVSGSLWTVHDDGRFDVRIARAGLVREVAFLDDVLFVAAEVGVQRWSLPDAPGPAQLVASWESGSPVAALTGGLDWIGAVDHRGRAWALTHGLDGVLAAVEHGTSASAGARLADGALLVGEVAGATAYRHVPGRVHSRAFGSSVAAVEVGEGVVLACGEFGVTLLDLDTLVGRWVADGAASWCAFAGPGEVAVIPDGPAGGVRRVDDGSVVRAIDVVASQDAAMLAGGWLVRDDGRRTGPDGAEGAPAPAGTLTARGGRVWVESEDGSWEVTPDGASRLPFDARGAVVDRRGPWTLMQQRSTLELLDEGGAVRCALPQHVTGALWGEDHFVASPVDGVVRVVRARGCEVVAVLRGHRMMVEAVDLHGDLLVTAGSDGELRTWDLAAVLASPPAVLADLDARLGPR